MKYKLLLLFVWVTPIFSVNAQVTNEYLISAISNNEIIGTVTGSGRYSANAVATLTASALNKHYDFKEWNDGDSNTPRTIIVTQDSSFVALFARKPISTILTNDILMGSVTGSGEFGFREPDTIRAIADENYYFDHWSDGSKEAQRILFLTQDTTITAIFAPIPTYEIRVLSSDTMMGTVIGGGYYKVGENTIIVANHKYGYKFSHWSDGITYSHRKITITNDSNLIAYFEPRELEKFVVNQNQTKSTLYSCMVDIGTSVLWGTCNLGALNEEDYGDYYAWGEIQPKESYTSNNYLYSDNPDVLPDSADAATFINGPGCRMPTLAEMQEISHNYSIQRENTNGVFGYRFFRNGKSIFLPAAEDSGSELTRYKPNRYGKYWTSTSKSNTNAYRLFIDSSSVQNLGSGEKYYGRPIRPVYPKDQLYKLNTITLLSSDSSDSMVIYCGRKHENIVISAVPKQYYHFSKWDDGNTDINRIVSTDSSHIYKAIFEPSLTGQCGDSLFWRYENHTLIFSGIGDMYNYTTQSVPWGYFQDSIDAVYLSPHMTNIGDCAFFHCTNLTSITIPNSVVSIGHGSFSTCRSLQTITIPNNVTSIGSAAFCSCRSLKTITIPNSVTRIGEQAFCDCTGLISATIGNNVTSIERYAFWVCSNLGSVIIGKSVTTIGEYAFLGCRKLYDIYCYSNEPPVAWTSSFENYNVYMQVPCENLRAYQMDAVFGSFKYIQCVGAEEAITDSLIVEPGMTNATFTWPNNTSAEIYILEIKKDGEVFCTLIFNAQGQLTSIAFAPSRDGGRQIPSAEQTTKGWKFTVTGLDAASRYTYDLDVRNASEQSIKNYQGKFQTDGITGIDQLSDSPSDRFTKIIQDGQLYILRDGKTYNAQGGEL